MITTLKFEPILKSIIWGGSDICPFKGIEPKQNGIGESWEISGVKNNISIVAEGAFKGRDLKSLIDEYKGELLGESIYKRFGNEFPLLIKFIDAQQDLSIQVHPDDELSAKRHNAKGKTEMWYVVKAKENAHLYTGFNQEMTSEVYQDYLSQNKVCDILNKELTKEGDVFFLPAGRVHAICSGLFIAEIQQTSDITYRLWDYNRTDAEGNPRELHTELAVDAIDYDFYSNYKTEYSKEKNKAVELESCQYFTTNIIDATSPIERDYNDIDSFVIWIVVEGVADYKTQNSTGTAKVGETILFPACDKPTEFIPTESCKILEVYIK